jgi:threonine dehydratase
MLRCTALEKSLGVPRVWIKFEGGLITGSFKVRGALWYVSNAKDILAGRALYTHSSGNWAQALAFAGQVFDVPIVIYMAENANPLKRERTLAWGASIRKIEGQPDEMTRHVQSAANEENGIFVSPYDHPLIIEGHASCGTEISSSLMRAGIGSYQVFTPVSGGGLAAGIAYSTKHFCGNQKVVTCVEPNGCDDFSQSLSAGERVAIAEPRASIADGLLANQVGNSNWPILKQYVDNSCQVSDDEMLAAMKLLFNELGLVAEPSGAATVAAIMQRKVPLQDHLVAVVSGSNVDRQKFMEWMR